MEIETERGSKTVLSVSQDPCLRRCQSFSITVHINTDGSPALGSLGTVRVKHRYKEQRALSENLVNPLLTATVMQKEVEDVHQRERRRRFVAVHL